MKKTIQLLAPAKLNLFLHIIGRRADGYHQLQTLFQFLSISDEITLNKRQDQQIVLQGALDGVSPEDNLVVKAARLLQDVSLSNKKQWHKAPLGADIYLQKNLPMGAGLGGGSSDAAATLLGLNALWRCGLKLSQLAELGLKLGADVPVFIYGQAAWAEGIGEQLTTVSLPEPWYIVLVPPCQVATGPIFEHRYLPRNSPRITLEDYIAGNTGNDCAEVVFTLYPPVKQAYDLLQQWGKARLTGTGACVFAAFECEDEANRVMFKVAPHFKAFKCKGMNISPCMEKLKPYNIVA